MTDGFSKVRLFFYLSWTEGSDITFGAPLLDDRLEWVADSFNVALVCVALYA